MIKIKTNLSFRIIQCIKLQCYNGADMKKVDQNNIKIL